MFAANLAEGSVECSQEPCAFSCTDHVAQSFDAARACVSAQVFHKKTICVLTPPTDACSDLGTSEHDAERACKKDVRVVLSSITDHTGSLDPPP